MPKILPEGHRVIIKPDDAEEKFGEIWIPKTAIDKQQAAMQTGEVVSVGPTADTLFEAPDGESRPVKEGDRVYFKKYAQYVFNIGDRHNPEVFWIINDADIIGVGA